MPNDLPNLLHQEGFGVESLFPDTETKTGTSTAEIAERERVHLALVETILKYDLLAVPGDLRPVSRELSRLLAQDYARRLLNIVDRSGLVIREVNPCQR